MKKIVFLSLFALCLPWTLVAQSIDDDCYELLLRYYYMSYYAYCLDGCKWNGG